MERVLDVYKRPYNADFPVVCMDESPKQLIEEGRPSQGMKPGQEARVDYEYVRHGGYSGQTEPLNPGQTEPLIPVKLSHLRV